MNHDTLASYLEVNTSNLADNIKVILSKIKERCSLSAVIKANAYGLGVENIAPSLFSQGISEFYVSHLQEGVELREILPAATIFVLHSVVQSDYELLLKNRLIPVLNCLQELLIYAQFASKRGDKLPANIFFETGMGRNGLQIEDLERLDCHASLQQLDVKYVMSHLACGDDEESPLNAKQLQLFEQIKAQLPGFRYSLANSAGVFLGEQYHFDQVRVGCALYGINPLSERDCDLKNVPSLHARMLFIRQLHNQQSIGYGARYTAPAGSWIATLEIGYADGYHRNMTGKARVFYKGQFFPVVGSITMDMIMVDVSTLSALERESLTHMEIFGDNISIRELANNAQTIEYEVLTSLGDRIGRLIAS